MNEQEAITEEKVKKSTNKKHRKGGGERRYRFSGRHKRHLLPHLRWWREILLVLLLITAVFFLINPFPRLARARAKAAAPVPEQQVAFELSAEPEAGYCIAGGFQDWDGSSTPLLDDGTEGDRTAGDGIYSRTITFTEPDRYLWRVLECGDWDTAVPESNAWVFVTQPEQAVTFTFSPIFGRADFWPRDFALTANDTLPGRAVAVGTFQARRWDSEDGRTQMRPSGNDQFELAYRVPLPGDHESYVAIQGQEAWIGATGRSTEPVPLLFTTKFPSEMVVFQYDGRTDSIAVLTGMPWWLSWLGYGWGARIIAGISLLGVFILGAQIGYRRIVLRPEWQESEGCPECHQHNLRRTNRHNSDYLLNMVGVPVRRYKCDDCDWEGRRMYRHHHR